jgi:hypothetical protein
LQQDRIVEKRENRERLDRINGSIRSQYSATGDCRAYALLCFDRDCDEVKIFQVKERLFNLLGPPPSLKI